MRAPFRRRRDFRKSASARGIWRSRCVKRYACAAATEFRRTRSEYCQRTRQPNSNPMPQSIGKPLRRKEDLRLLTGGGRYSDDVNLPGQAYAYVLRSPHAHARIRRIDTTAARAIPGVLAVLTGADVTADGLKDIPHADPYEAAGGHPAGQP
jgi:xanthine dehydrogenase molybdopterin-binding subunit B